MMQPVKLFIYGVIASLACLAVPAQAQLSAYSQDFELLNQADAFVLGSDGWLVYGNVSDMNGVYLFGYGAQPAPNQPGPAFSYVASGEGGPNQGSQQLLVYSDYRCCDFGGHYNGTDRVESNVYQEQSITAADVGTTWTFSFHAKRGDIGGSTTALAFIKTLDVANAFLLTNFLTIDMTAISTFWQEDNRISITIDASLVGQVLQFGFLNTASNFDLSGIFYDNIVFERECGNGALDDDEVCDDGNTNDGDGCSATCEVESGYLCSNPAPPNAVFGPSFEAGTPNPSWTEASTNFGTPLCDLASCGAAGASDGDWWAWFGGIATADEIGSVEQSIVIPPGADTLTFDLAIPAAATTGALNVTLDGNLLATFSEADGPFSEYRLESRNIPSFADGSSHLLRFESITLQGADATNFFVDDVRIFDREAAPSQCSLSNAICSTPSLALPDNSPAGASDSLVISGAGFLSDLNIAISTTHSWVGDLIYTLEHVETGTSIVLLDRPGLPLISPDFGCGNNDIDVVLDDAAATAAEDQCEPTPPAIGGVQTPNAPLSAFTGEPLGGEWTLTVSDNAAGDTGVLDEWCLIPTVSSVPDTDGDGVLDDVDNCTDVVNPGQEDFNGDLIGDICDADVTGPGNDGIVSYSGEITTATGAFSALTPVGTPAVGLVEYDPAAIASGFVGTGDILSINVNVGGFCFSTDSPGACPNGGADVPITSIDSAAVTFAGGLPTGGTSEITAFSPTFNVSIPMTIDHGSGTVFADGGALGTVSGTFTSDGPAGGVEDCFVNFLDLQRVKDAFFANPALPTWDPEVDFDGSDLINFSDLQIVKDQFFGPPGPSAAGCN